MLTRELQQQLAIGWCRLIQHTYDQSDGVVRHCNFDLRHAIAHAQRGEQQRQRLDQ